MKKRLLTIRFSKNHFFTLLAAGFLVAGTQLIQAQTFAPSVDDPFDLIGIGGNVKPVLADLDADGDLDLLTATNAGPNGATFNYYQNTGTAVAPSFAAGVTDPFNTGFIGGVLAPTFTDLDADGDLDLMTGIQSGVLIYYENTGTAAAFEFTTGVTNPFGLYGMGYWSCPAFADIDNDGDQDALIGEFYGDLYYFPNNGTAAAPAFGPHQALPFGLTDVGNAPKPIFRDIDNDGDQDLFVGTEAKRHMYFQNTGTAAAPAFAPAEINPFGLTITYDNFCAPAFGDLDGDGDPDLISGDYGTSFHYYQNTAPIPAPPAPANTTPASGLTVCNGTSAQLTASGTPIGTLKWFDAPTGGNLLGQGASFTTQSLTANTIFYVQDSTIGGVSASRTAVGVTVTQAINELSMITGQPAFCGHGTSVIQLTGAASGILYTLRNDLNDTIIHGPVNGNGFMIMFVTAEQYETTTYNVLAQTITGSLVCEKELAQTITITINPPAMHGIGVNVCYGEDYTYLDGTVSTDITADESHQSVFAGQAANGCDSIVTEYLFSQPQLASTFNPTICAEESFTINGTVYDASNPSGTEVFTSASGCDSTVTIDLDVMPALSGMHFEAICFGESTEVNGTTYNAANPMGTELFTASNGCDSTVLVMLMILPEITGSHNPTICFGESMEINGTIYDADHLSGTEVFTAANGCDSTVAVSLTILPEITGSYNPTICFGESMEINGTIYDADHVSGTEVFTAANGCDSTVAVSLTILPEITGSYNPTICFGESMEINGTIYDANNPTGTELYLASGGCDSTVTVSLNILPELAGSYTATMCADEEIEINGTIYNAGHLTGTEVLSSVDGCDSTVTINLSVFTAQVLVYPGTPGLLSAEPNDATYQWINCTTGEAIAGATGQSYTADENGSYAVLVTFEGCPDTSVCASPALLGIQDQSLSLVQLYPNPATTAFQLTGLESLAGIREMSLLDMNGKQLIVSTEATSEWMISNLQPGVYWLRIVHKTGVDTLRFIKE